MIFHIAGRRHGDDKVSVHTFLRLKTKDEAWRAFCRVMLPKIVTDEEIDDLLVGGSTEGVIYLDRIIEDPSDELLAALRYLESVLSEQSEETFEMELLRIRGAIKRAEEVLK